MKKILLALKMCSKKTDFFEEHQKGMSIDEICGLLAKLENRIELNIAENGEINEVTLNDQDKSFLRNLNANNLISIGHGLDYNLELIESKPIISKNNYPLLFNFICLQGEKNKGVIKENHGMGYHIHYVVVQQNRERRTNIVMTFSPYKKNEEESHKLYWEEHGSGILKHPDRFKNRRRKALYDTSSSFLTQTALKEFRTPKRSAKIMWPL